MNWGSLSAQQKLEFLLMVRGCPQAAAQVKGLNTEVRALGRTTKTTGEMMLSTERRTAMMGQAMYTLRRYAFLGTLAVTGFAVGIVKLGMSYNNAMQMARVALKPAFGDMGTLNAKLQELFQMAKYSPFVIGDLTGAFQRMFIAMNPIGISSDTIVLTLQNLTNSLSVAGKIGPGSLNRVAVALQHMAFMGRLTGRTVQQLAMDGLPIYDILNKKLGITGEQLHNIAKLTIPTSSVLNAINSYLSESPLYKNAAYRISMQTIPGQIAVMKDALGQLFGVMMAGPQGGSGIWASWQRNLGRLVGTPNKRGALDKLTSDARAGGATGAVLGLSNMVTGNQGLGKGFLELVRLGKNVANMFIHIWLPALIIATHSLAIFFPIIRSVNLVLEQLNKHANLVRYVLVPLAAAFILVHTAAIGWYVGSKLLSIALFGEAGKIMILIRALRIYILLVRTQGIVAATKLATGFVTGGVMATRFGSAIRLLLLPMKLLYVASLKFFVMWARSVLTFGLTKGTFMAIRTAILLTTAATWEFTAALLANPVVQITLAVLALGAALYIVVTHLHEISAWFKNNSAIYKLYQWGNNPTLPATPTAPKGTHHSSLNDWFNELNPLKFMVPGQNRRAIGGPVYAGMPYMVGERGSEMFVPKTNGTIVPHQDVKAHAGLSSAMQNAEDGKPIVVQLVVNRQVLAEQVARAKNDKIARR